MIFAENLKRIRNQKNISEEDMAESLSCTLADFQKIEVGEQEPKVQEIIAASEKLGVSTDCLLGLEKKADDKKIFNPLSALAGMALPGGLLLPDEDQDNDIDEELARELVEMASAIDISRNRRKGESGK